METATIIRNIEHIDSLTINVTVTLPTKANTGINNAVSAATVTPTVKKRGPRCGNNAKREWLYDAILAGVVKADKKGNIYIKKDGVWTKQKLSQQGKAIYDKQGKVIGHRGYMVFRLTWGGRSEVVYTHETVYMYYHGLIPYDKTVDHINNKKTNNRLKNLQLLTLEENASKGARKSNK